MAFHIRDPEADRAVRELAARKGVSLTDAVKQAVQNELLQMDQNVPFLERIRDLQQRVAAYPKTGLKADKAFYDELSGDI
ncbi:MULTISPECIES: type II toxin-antitoxin system VapB family antitoxin [Alphaproteobacteria]|jgi:antitoxin VapB|uniref:type II toxin-antitoxin system VapB family antitoxin n=1 Tax=Alphaproteobacteria TaxID=28211 RepID=UPI002735CDAE|nr:MULTISPECIES: type II toxin-antitoxin system VapB family antitoxin [Alphaproteobacteria]MDP3255908.1 type II toxin-antitoxin system VapB family antitoxin [Bosea sp. (in: a-proteobacteria)]MDP3321843.1 type II toxin-antitoxin system VapB family antitoxin [Bosea sp. (in: a-proteobacteria)]MDP3342304.1 type II toxin-antitoxin system VapB family antitoxin [Frigidibacter sp.]HEV2553625.1 type II toxin-antitoxin system VapB family antitoxin [Bosea sp. (in: a-proteobacteria)]